MQNMEWIQWHTQQVDMLVCWQELQEALGHKNCWEFVWKVHALFQVPKAWSCVIGVDNDHCTPLAHWSLEKYKFMLPPDLWFGTRDYWLMQPQQTLTYARALQYWAEKGQPLIPDVPCCLAESVLELRQAIEPLVTFSDEEVLTATAPSNWVEVTTPRPAEPAPVDCSLSHITAATHRPAQGSP